MIKITNYKLIQNSLRDVKQTKKKKSFLIKLKQRRKMKHLSWNVSVVIKTKEIKRIERKKKKYSLLRKIKNNT